MSDFIEYAILKRLNNVTDDARIFFDALKTIHINPLNQFYYLFFNGKEYMLATPGVSNYPRYKINNRQIVKYTFVIDECNEYHFQAESDEIDYDENNKKYLLVRVLKHTC